MESKSFGSQTKIYCENLKKNCVQKCVCILENLKGRSPNLKSMKLYEIYIVFL